MNYSEFLDLIQNELKRQHPESHIRLQRLLNPNDITRDALTLCSDFKAPFSPALYLAPYFRQYQAGIPIEHVARRIIQEYNLCFCTPSGKLPMPERLCHFGEISAQVSFRIINAATSKQLLANIPYRIICDFAVIYYLLFDMMKLNSACCLPEETPSPPPSHDNMLSYENNNGLTATALIQNYHLEIWHISEDELYQLALANTPRLLPKQLMNIFTILNEFNESKTYITEKAEDVPWKEVEAEAAENNPEKETETAATDASPPLMAFQTQNLLNPEIYCPMWVLTNTRRLYGAATLLYPNVLSECARTLGGSFYILPTSVHELILVPIIKQQRLTRSELLEMVCEINHSSVKVEERLTDNVYLYDSSTECLSC